MADPGLDAALAVLDPPQGGVPRSLLVGLSGGLDSTVLLHALAQCRGSEGLRAIHVHHGLHADADAWASQCQRLCDSLAVPLVVARVEVRRDSPLGLEGAAREARFAAFAAALAPGEALVLAHHRDDQAETVLLRLLRASGAQGLAAMRETREFAAGTLLRPLLGVSRAGLHAHAARHALAWCEDPSNASPDADRNFLRLRVLPALRERWPQADGALAGSAERLREDARLLALATREKLQSLQGDADWLPASGLRALDPGWRSRVLRQWIEIRGLPPLPGSAAAGIDQVLAASHDRAGSYRWQDARLRRWGDRLYAARIEADDAPAWSLPWNGRDPLALPDGGTLEFERDGNAFEGAFGPCTVATRRGGERLCLPGRTHSHALKDLLRETGLPPWERLRLPLLADAGGALLAVGDTLLSDRLQAWCLGHSTRLRWTRAAAD
jgi:tRNA(Ile)-lysidine synthase